MSGPDFTYSDATLMISVEHLLNFLGLFAFVETRWRKNVFIQNDDERINLC